MLCSYSGELRLWGYFLGMLSVEFHAVMHTCSWGEMPLGWTSIMATYMCWGEMPLGRTDITATYIMLRGNATGRQDKHHSYAHVLRGTACCTCAEGKCHLLDKHYLAMGSAFTSTFHTCSKKNTSVQHETALCALLEFPFKVHWWAKWPQHPPTQWGAWGDGTCRGHGWEVEGKIPPFIVGEVERNCTPLLFSCHIRDFWSNYFTKGE